MYRAPLHQRGLLKTTRRSRTLARARRGELPALRRANPDPVEYPLRRGRDNHFQHTSRHGGIRLCRPLRQGMPERESANAWIAGGEVDQPVESRSLDAWQAPPALLRKGVVQMRLQARDSNGQTGQTGQTRPAACVRQSSDRRLRGRGGEAENTPAASGRGTVRGFPPWRLESRAELEEPPQSVANLQRFEGFAVSGAHESVGLAPQLDTPMQSV